MLKGQYVTKKMDLSCFAELRACVLYEIIYTRTVAFLSQSIYENSCARTSL